MKIESAGAPFSSCPDRFVLDGYRESLSVEEMYEQFGKIEGITGLPFLYPAGVKTAKEIERYKLITGKPVGTICADTYTQRKWKNGSLAARDPMIRKEAVKMIKESMDLCHEVDGADILLWLAHDGYDYPFEDDYKTRWAYLVEGLSEVSSYRSDVKVTIEYKTKEPRTHQYISDVGKSLLLCHEVGYENLGLVIDFGHSIFAGENPAEAVDLTARHKRLFHIHMNDNYRSWDDDLLVGSIHFWETLEFFYRLNIAGYDGWFVIDIWPSRIDGSKALQENIKRIKLFDKLAKELPADEIKKMQDENRTMDIMELLREKTTRLI